MALHVPYGFDYSFAFGTLIRYRFIVDWVGIGGQFRRTRGDEAADDTPVVPRLVVPGRCARFVR